MPQTKYTRLLNLIPQLESVRSSGEIHTTTNEDGSVQMPYYIHHEAIGQLIDIMYEDDLVVVFDWGNWTEGRDLLASGNFEGAHLETCLKLLTLIIRADRFVEGMLQAHFRNGNIMAILKQIQALDRLS